MYIKFLTLLYSCVPTLPCKLPHAKHVTVKKSIFVVE